MGPSRTFPNFLSLKRMRSFDKRQQPSSDLSTTAYSTRSSTSTSSPTSATFSNAGKTSTSSFSSVNSSHSPNNPDSPTFPLQSKRSAPGVLPDVAEHPMEREHGSAFTHTTSPAEFQAQCRRSYDLPRSHSRSAGQVRRSADYRQHGDHSPDYKDYEDYQLTGRKSNDQNWVAFANGVRTKLGSLSRRSSNIGRTSRSVDERRRVYSPSPSPTVARSRAASRAQSARTSLELESHEPQLLGSHIETIMEDENQEDEAPAIFRTFEGTGYTHETEQLEIERRPTPLLPRFCDVRKDSLTLDSPLQSPTIVANSSYMSQHLPLTPADSPKVPSPALSQHASDSSFRKVTPTAAKRISDVPPLAMSNYGDVWAAKLGHEDFTIYPEPYMPNEITQQSRDILFTDWERARSKFSKHRALTETHFSATSAIFRWTERKWDFIDSQWREYSEEVTRQLYESGQVSYPSPKEPAPVQELADIEDPRMIQTSEIIGPMSQEPPRIGRNPSKRESFFSSFRAKTRNRRSLSGTFHQRTPSGL